MRLYAWDGSTFVRDVSEFSGANELRVMLTQPASNRVVSQSTFNLDDRSADLPELSFGDGLRMEFHLLNFSKEIVASGSTPTFESGPETPGLEFDVLISASEGFAPVGGLYEPQMNVPCEADADRENEFCQTRFDGRGLDTSLHRIGHTSARTEDGRIIYVGGGQVNPATLTNRVPGIQTVFDDVQVFTPGDGYVTNLAYNADTRSIRESDTLSVGRAFPQVTPLGDGEFLVTGGYWVDQNGNATPVRNVDMIDLNAEAGNRVNQLTAASGDPLKMVKARARHTATYLPSLESVLITGGVTRSQSPTDSIEIINLAQRAAGEVATLSAPRMGHETALLGQTGSESRIWVVGGRGDSMARASTEYVTITSDRELSGSQGAPMGVARYDFALQRYPTDDGDLFVAAGGYTSTMEEGRPTESIEFADPAASQTWLGSLTMPVPRGGASAVRLPGDRGGSEVLIAGGRNANARPVGTIQKLSFDGASGGGAPFSSSGIADEMVTSRYEAEVELGSNGRVVLSGGIDGEAALLDTFEYYNPTVRASFASPDSSN
jgi:hypothetical protein